MEITSLIVDILKLGLIGLVFLLMFMGFRLLNNEQRKKTPNTEFLKRASLFVWQSILVALLVGGVEISHRIFDNPSKQYKNVEICIDEFESLYQVSQHPNQTVETLRSAINNTWGACDNLKKSMKDDK